MGNQSAWVYGPTFIATSVSDSNGAVHYAGTWLRRYSASWWGGSGHESRVAGSTASYRFTGRVIELVARRVPHFGMAKVYLDGRFIATINLLSAVSAPTVVFTRSWADTGTHTLVVRIASRAMIDVDGFIVFR